MKIEEKHLITSEEINHVIDFLEMVKARCESGDTDELNILAKEHHMYDHMKMKNSLINLGIIKKIDDGGYVFRGAITRALATKLLRYMREERLKIAAKAAETNKGRKYAKRRNTYVIKHEHVPVPDNTILNEPEDIVADKEISEVIEAPKKKSLIVESAAMIMFVDASIILDGWRIEGTFKLSKKDGVSL